MPRNARKISDSGIYHIVQRGIGKQVLFEEEADALRFMKTIQKLKQEECFALYAYCLMENHVHLLVKADEHLDRIMKRLFTSYAFYFNTKYERSGHLFQDRYRSEPIVTERYLTAAVRYIHNNPQKAGICTRGEYKWSSYGEYITRPVYTDTEFVLDIIGGRESFIAFSASQDEAQGLDIREQKGVTDSAAKEIIKQTFHADSGTVLQTMCKTDRDKAIAVLKKAGLSGRQIERLTGINRGIIQRINVSREPSP